MTALANLLELKQKIKSQAATQLKAVNEAIKLLEKAESSMPLIDIEADAILKAATPKVKKVKVVSNIPPEEAIRERKMLSDEMERYLREINRAANVVEIKTALQARGVVIAGKNVGAKLGQILKFNSSRFSIIKENKQEKACLIPIRSLQLFQRK